MREELLPSLDLYKQISYLVKQIPRGMISTPKKIAIALGDSSAAKAVTEVVERAQPVHHEPFHRIVSENGKPILSGGEQEAVLGTLRVEGVDTSGNHVSSVDRYLFEAFSSSSPLKTFAGLQHLLASQVSLKDESEEPIQTVAACDVAYRNQKGFGFCVLMDSKLAVLEEVEAEAEVYFPYISGYLVFREGPLILKTLKKLSGPFDALIVNGHGIAHPRGCGLASHIGLVVDKPTIGIATKKLVGETVMQKNSLEFLEYKEQIVGAKILREGFAPIYVSPGANISLERSIQTMKNLLKHHKFPEPLWRAHNGAKRLLQGR